MIRKTVKLLSAALGLLGCLALLPACTHTLPPAPTEDTVATLPPEEYTAYPELSGPNGATISTAASYANRVNGYYSDSARGEYVLENTNMKLTYNLSGSQSDFYGVARLENPEGGVYLENTMDTYVRMKDGNTYFAGTSPARANLYDQGYYYYNIHILDQVFGITDETSFDKLSRLETNDCYRVSMMSKPAYTDGGAFSLTVLDNYDPYVCFRVPEGKYKCSEYDAFTVTLKSSLAADAQLFYIESTDADFIAEKYFNFKVIPDGNYHTYALFYNNAELSGYLKAFRLDIGAKAGETIEVKEFALVSLKGTLPCFKLDRNYNLYSDKLHECIRLVAYDDTEEFAAVGTVTRIPKARVEKLVIGDNAGAHGVIGEADPDNILYAGFDIKDAGIFGIILGSNPVYAGKLSVSDDGENYVIVQELDCSSKHVKRGGDTNMARRVYVDGSHDFGAFLQETYFERYPLDVVCNSDASTRKASVAGYNELTGAYTLRIPGAGNFNAGYEAPLAEHKICFTVNADNSTRKIYVRGNITTDGCLECAAVLDADNMLLPIHVEVCKNFAHDGEELFYTNNDSISYGYSVIPLVTDPAEPTTLTLAMLYEQWGNYRLKQVSSIRFHSAYYHLSLGVTETNCIHLYSTGTRLPDHRGLSTVYWSDEKLDVIDANGNPTGGTKIHDDQPQHSNVGTHTFLQYTDAEGNFNSYENCGRTQITDSGPTMCDITLNYLSFDGKVYQTYRHVEMPQTDENRAYYEVTYEFLGDVTVNNVISDFSLYRVEYPYAHFGWLNENGECMIADTHQDSYIVYALGTDHPYFDLFHKIVSNPDVYTAEASSCNVSFLLDSCDITLGGKAYTGGFVVREGNRSASFTLNIDGAMTFRKGDRISFRCILMPWGDYYSEDDTNVRLVRVNTLLNPIRLEAASGEVQPDAIVPTVRSVSGTNCEFTLSGGSPNVRDLPSYAAKPYTKYRSVWERDYNVTVKAGGFSKLGVPVIYELKNGDWVRYEVASSLGYDGYNVAYMPDGTFTYSFVVTMTEAQARTFKMEVN